LCIFYNRYVLNSCTIDEVISQIFIFEKKIRITIKDKFNSFYGKDWWEEEILKNIKETVEIKLNDKIKINPNRKYESIDLFEKYKKK